jgi:hypothetical protein
VRRHIVRDSDVPPGDDKAHGRLGDRAETVKHHDGPEDRHYDRRLVSRSKRQQEAERDESHSDPGSGWKNRRQADIRHLVEADGVQRERPGDQAGNEETDRSDYACAGQPISRRGGHIPQETLMRETAALEP